MHVPVHGDGREEEGAAAAVHDQHEEAGVAERRAEAPAQPGEVAAGPEWQCRAQQEVGHGLVEEQNCAALPGPQVEAEDPEGQPVPQEPERLQS